MIGAGRLHHITAYGHEIRVAERFPADGSIAGRPLVLCNGIGANIELLQPFVDALDESIHVVRFDVPGVGGSPLPPIPYNYASLSVLLAKVLDRLGYNEVDILGISWGGGLAQQFALQNPRRCKRVVLVSTATGMLMVPGLPRGLSRLLTPPRYRDVQYAAKVAGHLYGGRMRHEPELALHAVGDQSRSSSRRGYLLQLTAGIGWTSLPFLPLIRQPVLVLAGDDDPLIPLMNARIMQRLLPRATVHVYADGHLGLVTCAHELGPIVACFLRPAGL
jgi:poly(3-hydroxyalkanoate) depolymerase